jgi:electron transport complex protein RnfE
MSIFRDSAIAQNPVWVQLLGLCPLLAVSNSVVNALGLALASTLVLLGANGSIALLRRQIPDFARLPCFVLIIATFTTIAMLVMQAFAFDLYLKIALFIQIIVTNCMILGRAEAYASRQPVGRALQDAAGTAAGFSLALIVLGSTRELIATGGLFANLEALFGPAAESWQVSLFDGGLLIASLPPGAFIIAGLLLAAGQTIFRRRTAPRPATDQNTDIDSAT